MPFSDPESVRNMHLIRFFYSSNGPLILKARWLITLLWKKLYGNLYLLYSVILNYFYFMQKPFPFRYTEFLSKRTTVAAVKKNFLNFQKFVNFPSLKNPQEYISKKLSIVFWKFIKDFFVSVTIHQPDLQLDLQE